MEPESLVIRLKLKIPPVAQAIIAVVFVWLLDRVSPMLQIHFKYQGLVAAAIIGVGVLVALAGVAAFIKLRTTLDPRYPEKTVELVIVGIYRRSRNPMYLGILVALIGIVIYSGSVFAAMVPPLFVVSINWLQIIPEERALIEKFGRAYLDYTRRVRRWV